MSTKKKQADTHIDHEDHTHEPLVRKDDGTVEITFAVPWEEISVAREKTALEMGKNVTVPGFRVGKAPLDRLMSHLPADQLLERALSSILPVHLAKAITEHNVKPAIYPRFELLHAHEGQEWTVLATTCEIPEFKLGNYKKDVVEALKALPKEASVDEKQNAALIAFGKTIDVKVPHILVEEEANGRLSNLLSRIEKLGMSLENFLASQKKTAPELRAEYESQAENTLKMELSLMKLAADEKIVVSEQDVTDFIAVAQLPEQKTDADRDSQISMVQSILTKRKAIEFLASQA
jgi:FKBP-type peptidyl-prolyl cis-trans isomerase (trigger factor)